MKKRLIALLLCLVMLLTCMGAALDAVVAPADTAADGTEQTDTAVPAESTGEDTTEPDTTAEPTESAAPVEETVPSAEPTEQQPTEDEETPAEYEIYADIMPKTVVYTDAGPFMPAVNVAEAKARSLIKAVKTALNSSDGFVKNKTAEALDSGMYKITIEAYATGNVTTTTSTKPVDIVLVLDQSGSMAYNFNGEKTSTNSDRRQYAMKQAVGNFIKAVGEKYNSNESDHRISIVTFNGSADVLCNWTFADSSGVKTLTGAVDSLVNEPLGGTQTDLGMQIASSLMNGDYNYTGANTTRQKVVILFTDGVPGQSGFDISVANNAITAAKSLKDSGVTVYSVGIFNGADPNQLYGSRYAYYDWGVKFKDCNGNIGESWRERQGIFSGGDVDKADIPAGNRFLNYISSGYPDSTEIGLENDNAEYVVSEYHGYKITKNFSKTGGDGYYLTANDINSLNTIFSTISQNIGSTSVTLGSSSVVRDVVTKYFEMPSNASDISVMTYDCTGKNATTGKFEFDENSGKELDSKSVSITGNTIDVSGFDFAANYCREKEVTGQSGLGKKLVISFTVKPKSGFIGGNDVPTNADTSGIYENSSSDKATFTFPVPTVNVPINPENLTGQDANVYYLGSVPGAENLCQTYTNTDGMYDYVDVSYSLSGNVSNTEDKEYTVTATITPKTNGANSAGEPNDMSGVTKEATSNVYVYVPELTFQDSEIELGQTPNYTTGNYVSTNWVHVNADETKTYSTAVNMYGTAPTVTWEGTPTASDFKVDTEVSVKVKVNDNDVANDKVQFVHEECKLVEHCQFDSTKCQFIVHLKTFDLTITKSINSDESKLYGARDFIFNVKSANGNTDIDVVVHVGSSGTGSTVVKGLPIGTYTVTEDTAWSWRYTLQGVASLTGTVVYTSGNNFATYTPNGGANNEIVFTNNFFQAKWLSFTASVRNFFAGNN